MTENAELIGSLKEWARLFSNRGKDDRERLVVEIFLQSCSIDFLQAELKSLPQCCKTDVRFRDANFQVKEIVNPGTRRSDEIHAIHASLRAAKPDWPQFVYDVPSPTTIYELVSDQASRRALEYSTTKHELDLLFYVTRKYASLIREGEIDREFLASLGWRSISCLAGTQATVLFVHENAPEFLRSRNVG